MKLKSQAQFVDKQGKLTPEAFASLTRVDGFLQETTSQYQAKERCQIILPVAALVNIGREGSGINVTAQIFSLGEGDVLTLGASTTFTVMPI